VRKTRLIAPIAKSISEASIRERPVQIIHEKGQITARGGVNDYLQGWKDRQ
jgi:hypothetical protein